MFLCPCCGYLTLHGEPPGTFDICPVCFWIDDDSQFKNSLSTDGANDISLDQAQSNFVSVGAILPKYINEVRVPKPNEYTMYDQAKERLPQEIPDNLVIEGRPLDDIGILEIAWSRRTARQVLHSLSNSDVVVLGGDVYVLKSGHFHTSLDNWYCERKNGETNKMFSQRSIEASLRFIESYNDPEDNTVLYVLVFSRHQNGKS